MQKYYNPRLHNAVVAGTGMEHPRRPHVVLGSELNGYVQGDLVDANGICDLIHEKNVDTYAKLEALETSLKNESKARVNSIDNLSEQIDRTIANRLGSTDGGCDCAYQVIIKGSFANGVPGPEMEFEVEKGDYATAKTKIENGEYVDFIDYVFVNNGISTNDVQSVKVKDSFIDILGYDHNNDANFELFWTADGISTKDHDNPGTGPK